MLDILQGSDQRYYYRLGSDLNDGRVQGGELGRCGELQTGLQRIGVVRHPSSGNRGAGSCLLRQPLHVCQHHRSGSSYAPGRTGHSHECSGADMSFAAMLFDGQFAYW